MVPRYNISLEEERDLALRRLQRICDNKFISVLDFWHNPLRIFAAHELAAIIDPAMTTKMTVQFNLFGGTVLKLGTERHHKDLLAGIDNLQVKRVPPFFFFSNLVQDLGICIPDLSFCSVPVPILLFCSV